jgi:hypothetical protein
VEVWDYLSLECEFGKLTIVGHLLYAKALGAPMGQQAANGRTRKRHLVAWLFALAAITTVVVIGWQAVSAPRGSGLLHTLPPLLLDLHDDEQRLGQIILENYIEYRANARNWSAAYFGCLFLSAACASLAGLVIKLEFFLKNEALKKDLAAVLAMLAALLITLSTVGGFHQRWWANRLAAAKIERLAYAFMAPDRKGNLEAISLQLQVISYERNEEIVSGDSDRSKATETRGEVPKGP